jgi:hypothetical protein
MGSVMPFKVQVGPPQISIHYGQAVLITEESEQINWPSEKGFYFFDTRIVSSWTIYRSRGVAAPQGNAHRRALEAGARHIDRQQER